MALKAGYIGIKKSMLGLINSLASAKLIKSFGDGLNLTSAGKLNMTAATASKIGGVKVGEGLAIEDGVLNCTVTGGFDYSTDEFDTGQKWTDGRTIYGKTFHIATPTNNGELMQLSEGDLIINIAGSFDFTAGGNAITRRALPMYFSDSLSFAVQEDMSTYKVFTLISATNRASNMDVTIFYVKASEVPAE